jgi:hypothetical protein
MIQELYPGSRIPYPDFFIPESGVPDPQRCETGEISESLEALF